MTSPFDETQALYRFTPTEKEKGYSFWRDVDEYILIRNMGNISRTQGYFLVAGEWKEDVSLSHEPIIARLLTERDALIQQRDSEWERRKQATTARQRVEAERDIYQKALEDAWRRGYTSPATREALERGKQIREGE